MRDLMLDKMARYNMSLWLLIASLILTATMMHPTLATVLVLLLNTVLLFAMRAVAKLEARRRADGIVLRAVRPADK